MRTTIRIMASLPVLAAGVGLWLADANAGGLEISAYEMKKINGCLKANVPPGFELASVESASTKITVGFRLKDPVDGTSEMKFIGTRQPDTVEWNLSSKSAGTDSLQPVALKTLYRCIGPDHWQIEDKSGQGDQLQEAPSKPDAAQKKPAQDNPAQQIPAQDNPAPYKAAQGEQAPVKPEQKDPEQSRMAIRKTDTIITLVVLAVIGAGVAAVYIRRRLGKKDGR